MNVKGVTSRVLWWKGREGREGGREECSEPDLWVGGAGGGGVQHNECQRCESGVLWWKGREKGTERKEECSEPDL